MPDVSAPAMLRFDAFTLDVRERRLIRGNGEAVALPSRYFDLLVALASNSGSLVTKDDLFAEVWPGVVVGDAALSQGIRAVRVALGDEAGSPRFVETVAGHGYRFIASVETLERIPAAPPAVPTADRLHPSPTLVEAVPPMRRFPLAPRSERLSRTGAVTGALAAALVGGVLYGVALGGNGPHPVQTIASVTAMGAAVAGLGAAAVATGARTTERRGSLAALLGAAVGGALIGLVGAYVGASVLMTLTGKAVGTLTGPSEGFFIGLAAASGPLLVRDKTQAVVVSTVATLAAFALLAASGHPTFVGSLEQTLALPDVPLRLDGLAPGGLTDGLRILLGGLEGALFGFGFSAGAVVKRP